MPMIVSNRSTMICYYRREEEDGTLQMLNSSIGNEKLVEKYKEKIGSDVVAQQFIGGSRIQPVEDGVLLTQMMMGDPGGTLPTWIKGLISRRNASHGKYTVNYLLQGEVPE